MGKVSRRVQLQVVGLGSFLKVVEQHIKEGASVVMSNKVGEAPNVKGKWYCCYVEYNSEDVVVEKKEIAVDKEILEQLKEIALEQKEDKEESEPEEKPSSDESIKEMLQGLTKADIIKKVKADTGVIIMKSNKNHETILNEAVEAYKQ